jgi:hypothetical protein
MLSRPALLLLAFVIVTDIHDSWERLEVHQVHHTSSCPQETLAYMQVHAPRPIQY